MRWQLEQDPSRLGPRSVTPAQPPLPRPNVKDRAPCVATAVDAAGRPVLPVCSVGVDLDLSPCADARAAAMAATPGVGRGGPGVWLVTPPRDLVPVTAEPRGARGSGVVVGAVLGLTLDVGRLDEASSLEAASMAAGAVAISMVRTAGLAAAATVTVRRPSTCWAVTDSASRAAPMVRLRSHEECVGRRRQRQRAAGHRHPDLLGGDAGEVDGQHEVTVAPGGRG